MKTNRQIEQIEMLSIDKKSVEWMRCDDNEQIFDEIIKCRAHK